MCTVEFRIIYFFLQIWEAWGFATSIWSQFSGTNLCRLERKQRVVKVRCVAVWVLSQGAPKAAGCARPRGASSCQLQGRRIKRIFTFLKEEEEGGAKALVQHSDPCEVRVGWLQQSHRLLWRYDGAWSSKRCFYNIFSACVHPPIWFPVLQRRQSWSRQSLLQTVQRRCSSATHFRKIRETAVEWIFGAKNQFSTK